MPNFSFLRIVGLILVLAPAPAAAADLLSFGFDVPMPPATATPTWLGQPSSPSGAFATLDLPVLPPNTTQALLLTVVFNETAGSFLRVQWSGSTNGSQTLSNNLYEGIGMANRRSLLIPAEVMAGGTGTIRLESGGSVLGVQHIEMEWLETKEELASAALTDQLVTTAHEATQTASALDGQPASNVPAAWHGSVVNLPLTDVPQRIEQGVDFNFQIDHAPSLARISFAEAGLPWGKHLVVWLNQARVALVTPAVPDLESSDFGTGASPYVGWRKGVVYLPGTLLKEGLASLQFSVEDDVTPSTEDDVPLPLAMKDLVVQLAYPLDAATTTVSPATVTPSAVAPATAPAGSAPATPAASAPSSLNSTLSDPTLTLREPASN